MHAVTQNIKMQLPVHIILYADYKGYSRLCIIENYFVIWHFCWQPFFSWMAVRVLCNHQKKEMSRMKSRYQWLFKRMAL